MNITTLTVAAAYAINQFCNALNLGNLAIRWDGTDPDQFVFRDPNDIRAFHMERHVATVDITHYETRGDLYKPQRATVYVHNHWWLIRPDHMSDYNPEHYGITQESLKAENVEIPDLSNMPTVPFKKYPRRRHLKVKRQLSPRRF